MQNETEFAILEKNPRPSGFCCSRSCRLSNNRKYDKNLQEC